jgi:hypothetical protein
LEPDKDGFRAFAIVPEQVKVAFDRNEKDEVVGLKLHKEGQVFEVPRKGTARAKELSEKRNERKIGSGPSGYGKESKLTSWQGTLDAKGKTLRLEIVIAEDAAGELSGELCSLDQNNMKIKTTEVKLDSDTFSFSISQLNASFAGILLKNGTVAEGTFIQNDTKVPLTLTKKDEK